MLTIAAKAAESVAQKITDAASRKIRTFLAGDENKKALARSVKWGVLCMVQELADLDAEAPEALVGTLESFFAEPDVTRELGKLLAGEDWDEAELSDVFAECAADQNLKDDLPFTEGLRVFKAAFLANALTEEAFQEFIKTSNILKQTHILQAIRTAAEKLPALLSAIAERLSTARPEQTLNINADNVVSGVQIIINQLTGITMPPDELEAQYLNAFCDQCDALDLSITDDKYTHDSEPAVGLSQVFTRLYLDGVTRYGDESVKDAVTDSRKRSGDSRPIPDREKESKPVTAIEAIAALDRLAITGQPGGGKSTLVNYLFVQLAQARLQGQTLVESVEHWQGPPLLPVRIILRKFAREIPDDRTTGEAGLVWDYIDTMIKGKKGQNCPPEVCRYVRRTLEQEGGIVLFDGLDEVGYGDAVSKRQVIKQAVQDFAHQLEKAKIVITSRPYAYRSEDTWRLPENLFPVVRLALFNKEQVKTFAWNWYRKVGMTVKGWDEPYCDNMANYFYHAVDTRERLFPIVRNPLLLTMAVQLHSRDNFLPQKRAELYEKVIMLLLARWENNIIRDSEEVEPEQGTDSILRLQLSADKLLKAMARVAYKCHRKQLVSGHSDSDTADISRGELIEELEEDFGYESGARIIAYIQYRAGILQGKDSRTYSFMHRTFQEYLTARHILELDAFDEIIYECLAENIDWWQEVFLLMAGGAKTRRASTIHDLVCWLLKGKAGISDFASVRDFRELWLAGQALWETDYLDECVGGKNTDTPHVDIFEKVHTCLEEALTADEQLDPAQRVEAGHWLARLEDHRADVLGAGQMKFCPIPAGPFSMGDGRDDDCPEHPCDLKYGYRLAQYPVTVAQYRRFDEAAGYGIEKYWKEAADAKGWEAGRIKFWGDEDWRRGMPELPSRFDYANHPMVYVSWYESLAFCRWLTDYVRDGKGADDEIAGLVQKGWRFLLPSEAEWEKGARGAVGKRVYPWGDDIDANRANYSDTGIGATSAVGCFPPRESSCGCSDMAGNVWEWCRNVKADYPYHCDEREQVYGHKGSDRVIRGGSWGDPAGHCRCSYRYWINPDYRYDDLGFRVVLVPSSVAKGSERSELL
jgi:formylglycine-generating enzyme required for sulfatase activity